MSSFVFEEDVSAAKGEVEAILFVAGEPLSIDDISSCIGRNQATVKSAIEELAKDCEKSSRGVAIRYINSKVQMHTKTEYGDAVENYLQPMVEKKFSKSLMETLSVIAYKQPITRSEIEDLRGVRCEYAVSRLLSMDLIEEVGRKQVIGRPALFGTSDIFLEKINIEDISMLPNRDIFSIETEDQQDIDTKL